MGVPQDRQALLDAVRRTYAALRADLSGVPASLAVLPELEGHVAGTLISVDDLIAYLVGWNRTVLKWHEREAAGRPIDYPDTGFKGNELGRLAQRFYADLAGAPHDARLAMLDDAYQAIMDLIESHDDHSLYGLPWYGKWTRGRMIQFNTSSPYVNARKRLRPWMKQHGLTTARAV